jgi:hypothetical protein
MRRLLVVLPWLLISCGDQRPCTSCPQLDGAYLVSWQQGFPQTGCPQMGPRPVNLNFTQQGNQLAVLIGGNELRGTLYDTYDFSVSGGDTATSYSLRGRAVVSGPTAQADGGAARSNVRLVGTLFTRTGSGATACDLSENYTADRL